MLEKTSFGWKIKIPDEIRESRDALMSELNGLIAKLEKENVSRLLYEINDPSTKLSGSDLVGIANLLATWDTSDLKIAVYSPQYKEHMTAAFIENLMVSKKMLTKYFNDEAAAVKWLESDK